MNHLAHFFLSFKNEDLIVGNWLADFIGQKDVAALEPDLQKGVFLHRQIDSFADAHEGIKLSVERLRPFAGRYAKVLIDIFNDHSLSKNWSKFSPDEPIGAFSSQIYAVLRRRKMDLPPALAARTENMIRSRWLEGYGSPEGLGYVIGRFEERMSKNEFYQKEKADARAALDAFLADQPFFDQNFLPFFEAMIEKMRPFEPSKI